VDLQQFSCKAERRVAEMDLRSVPRGNQGGKNTIYFIFFKFFGVCGYIAVTPVASLLLSYENGPKTPIQTSVKPVLRIRIRTPGTRVGRKTRFFF
jgi:hypothetical protein